MQYVMYFRFVDDVMFSDNRPGKGNANTCRSCTDSDSGYSSHGGVDLETGSDV